MTEPGPCTEDHDHEAELARLMKVPGALDSYHGYMHGFHGFPFEGCDMTDLGLHEGAHFEIGLEHGRIRRAGVREEEGGVGNAPPG